MFTIFLVLSRVFSAYYASIRKEVVSRVSISWSKSVEDFHFSRTRAKAEEEIIFISFSPALGGWSVAVCFSPIILKQLNKVRFFYIHRGLNK